MLKLTVVDLSSASVKAVLLSGKGILLLFVFELLGPER